MRDDFFPCCANRSAWGANLPENGTTLSATIEMLARRSGTTEAIRPRFYAHGGWRDASLPFRSMSPDDLDPTTCTNKGTYLMNQVLSKNRARLTRQMPKRCRGALPSSAGFVPVFIILFAWLDIPSTLEATPAIQSNVDSPTQEISPTQESGRDWPQWRGPLGTGEAPEATPPVIWSESENVKWKTRLPGLGHSTPVIWGDRIFLTAARPVGDKFPPRPDPAPGAHDNKLVDSRYEFIGLAIDRESGEIVWQKVLHDAIPHEGAHYTASLASASPVTDGQHVFFHFGSYGLYCLDREGRIVWQRDLGRMNTKHGHGEGSSPVLHDESLIVNWDHEGDSKLMSLDAKTGETKWQVTRNEVTSWSSPIVAVVDGRPQVIVAGTNRVRGYDLETGKIVWQCGGLSHNIVATPVFADGMLFVGSSYEIRQFMALRLSGASGDITTSKHVVWQKNTRTPYVPSPLYHDGFVYFLRHYQGILSRVKTASGDERTGPFRLPGMRDIYASPIWADGRIYIADRSGLTAVLTDDDEPDLLSINRLDDRFNASPVAIERSLYLRGERHLYRIEEDQE